MCIINKRRLEFVAIARIDAQTRLSQIGNATHTRRGRELGSQIKVVTAFLSTRYCELGLYNYVIVFSTIYFTVASVNSYSCVNLGTTEKDSQVEIKDDDDNVDIYLLTLR